MVRWLLAEWEPDRESVAPIQLRSEDGRVLVDRVQRITRETIVYDGHPVQCLRVWYGEGERCRDTVVLNRSALTLHRDADESKSIDLPILPAQEFLCDDLLQINGVFVGIGLTAIYLGPEPVGSFSDMEDRRRGHIFDREAYETWRAQAANLAVGGRFFLGVRGPFKVEATLGFELYSANEAVGIPLLAGIRWFPFGELRISSKYHYAPNACQFMTSGDKAARPPKSACRPGDALSEKDSTVYVVEERWASRPEFVPFLYAEAGVVFEGPGSSMSARPSLFGRPTLFNTDESVPYMVGIGVGLPIVGPLTLGLGYRHVGEKANTVMFSATAELW
jgi:hypothetical protein